MVLSKNGILVAAYLYVFVSAYLFAHDSFSEGDTWAMFWLPACLYLSWKIITCHFTNVCARARTHTHIFSQKLKHSLLCLQKSHTGYSQRNVVLSPFFFPPHQCLMVGYLKINISV